MAEPVAASITIASYGLLLLFVESLSRSKRTRMIAMRPVLASERSAASVAIGLLVAVRCTVHESLLRAESS